MTYHTAAVDHDQYALGRFDETTARAATLVRSGVVVLVRAMIHASGGLVQQTTLKSRKRGLPKQTSTDQAQVLTR